MLSIGKELTPQQRLHKGIIDINGNAKYVALAGITMIGERAVKSLPPMHTACTNGRDEWYDPEFVNKLSDAELRFVLLHENYHKLYRHLSVYKYLFDIDRSTANAAADHVINLKIMAENPDGFAKMPTDTKGNAIGCADTRFTGWPLVKVFNELRKEGKAPGTGFDEHDWEGAAELSDTEKHELEREIDEAIRQGALAAGKIGTSDQVIDIKELLKPQVDWRAVLREFVTTTCAGSEYSSYRRPNRRYMSSGIYMPTGINEKVGELVYAFDMSGSTSMGKMRPAFITEGQSVCDTVTPEKLRVLYWDTSVTRAEVYEDYRVKEFVKETKPTGGGGTDVECVAEYLKEEKIKPQAIVIFTDGEVFGWGDWDCPVLWVIVDHPHITPPIGKVVHVDSNRG